ncbi:FAD/NAD(P)-binding domain-containing protein [Mycena chlorophos]|uniref:FAD/NAD(P)-binding domain-containing protein n=1 Tax=Mycena chlorophos TaxID=658473 RepID=A0A8H6RZA1_MYCCL|nr:FAD/NAD(P)-binding domain-containing protein [Mycena chlorophos]
MMPALRFVHLRTLEAGEGSEHALPTNAPQARPLHIIIVGAGLGGLTAAAAALRRAGHIVKIFESSQIKTEIGAGIALQSTSVGFKGINTHDAVSGDGRGIVFPHFEQAKADEVNALTCHRSDAHDELKRLAIGYGDDGFPPAEPHLGLDGYDPEARYLASGEVVSADVAIAADGVHSTIRKGILGETVTANATGSSCFRCLFDTSALDDYPHLAWLKDGVEEPWNISAHDGKILTFFLKSQEAKLWTRAATKKDILASVPNFHPKLESRSLLDLPIATPILFSSIMGDAAHATLPTLGEGAAMAIEDSEAGMFGVLLPLGTTPEQVPKRLEAFQERGEFVDVHSAVAGADGSEDG